MTENAKTNEVTNKEVIRPVTKKHSIPMRVSPDAIADEIASRVSGELVNLDKIYDVKTGTFKNEDEIRASGCTFSSLTYRKNILLKDMTKKDRVTKEKPVWGAVWKTWTMLFILEVNWRKFIEKRSEKKPEDIKIDEKRSNGVENYHCQAVGKTRAGASTINGVVFQTVQSTEYTDENGDRIDPELLVNFLPKKQTNEYTTKKYGITADKMPAYRTPRIDNLSEIKAFGITFIPTPE